MPLTETQLIEWAKRHGYSRKNAHWHKEITNKDKPDEPIKQRLIITSISARIERRSSFHSPWMKKPDHYWHRVRSAYLRDLSISAEDKLVGMSLRGCQAKKKEGAK